MLNRPIRRTRFRPPFGLGLLAVLTGVAALAVPPQPAEAADDELEIPDGWISDNEMHERLAGKPVPKLQLRDWINGPPSSLKGRIVVIDFWATWCGPCLKAIPKNNKIAREYADDGVVLIGVCTSDGQGKLPQVAREHNIRYPVARDPNSASAKAWGIKKYPTYAIVGRDGKVLAYDVVPSVLGKTLDRILKHEKESQEESQEKQDKEEKDAPAPSSDDASDDASDDGAAAGSAEIKDAWLEGSPQRRLRLEKRLGDDPPALKVTNWINSEAMSLDELKGKVVVLDFWATWCLPCIRRIPHANELVEKYGDDGLVFIGVCHTRGADKMAEMVEDEGIEYPVAADVSLRTTKAYHVDGFPDYYIIDRAGNLRVADCTNESVEEAIKALLKEPAPESVSEPGSDSEPDAE